MEQKLQAKLEKIFEDNYEPVEIEENVAITKHGEAFEICVIAVINTFEAYGVKCGEHYYDGEMEDWVIPFIN